MSDIFVDNDWSEHYVKRGDPSKPTYYIIRSKTSGTGLFWYFSTVAGNIRYALSKGWLPVVDMQNYPNNYLAPEKLGKENAWEYYFEQPLRIGLEEAYSGENVILGIGSHFKPSPNFSPIFANEKILMEWQMLVKLGLIKVKAELMEEILAIRQKLFSPNDRVLGIKLRGTDYTSLKLKYHPIQPPIELASRTSFEKLKAWKCDKMFLATEDKSIVEIFKDTFGDLCVTYDHEYVNYPGHGFLHSYGIERENDHFLLGKDYLIEVVLLSMCNSFIATGSSGANGAMILAEKFDNVFKFDLGHYGVYK